MTGDGGKEKQLFKGNKHLSRSCLWVDSLLSLKGKREIDKTERERVTERRKEQGERRTKTIM